ncbi:MULTISPECIES: recombinase family protein [Bacteroides]|jgi:site-specific DNA recombinase|uniref:Recombinase family protein n=1 Tax=Bacteroides difficilis TaxID=2763021 RepID=A0ABR7CG91_9BACE|nr:MULTISPECIES: recombinase family protein [Bacteroides]MBC5606817.1 recombinase family protein [Bacteroides difficilis]MCA4456879.1 recombinase family protein [Bacteroides xylanisolvens]MCA4461590.1 recombinase family protein [Bacteroides xylanisolvens]MCA4475181.1 recombinase family protein [Bacteroides xylanisolvens]MCA4484426.1 recombinase family protein [Bacteroides xylanisolvens]
MNVLGYVRVSTDEQAEKGFSLEFQTKYIRQHCEVKKNNLIAIYDEDCSAKNFNRPRFKEMKTYAFRRTNHVDMILVTRWDRFARNLTQALVQIEKFKEMGIEVNSVEQHIDYGQPDYIVMLSMYLSTSHSERLKISRRVKECNFAARKNGKYTNGHPAKGYYWKKHAKNEESELLIDRPVANLIVESFNLFATGLYSADRVRQMMAEKGLRMQKQSFLNMLRNRLYIGEVHVPSYNGSKDEWVKGIHEPLIDRELFNAVQTLLDGKKRNHPKAKAKVVPELFLRNFLVCPVCNGNLTGSFSRSRNGSRYPYYHCNHSGHQRIKAEEANRMFVQFLNSFIPDEAILDLFKLVIADLKQVLKSDINKQIKCLDDEIMGLENKINEVDDMLIGKTIDVDTHKRIVTRHKQCIDELRDKQSLLKDSDIKEVQEKIEYSTNILTHLGDYFEKADAETKIKLVGSIIVGKMQFLENSYRTAEMNEVLNKIGMISSELQSLEKEKATHSGGLSNLALPLGLEPRTL